ncbi:MAG: septal ring lytic transglycosylase RlpA family protein [Acidobacteriota bacterium]
MASACRQALRLAAVVTAAWALTACSTNRFETPRIGTTQRGLASWYGHPFHGRATASGVIYDMHAMTAAHKELPLGTVVDVEHLESGRSVRVEINDRGPFVRGRVIDLSYEAARRLGMVEAGVAPIELEVVSVGGGPSGPIRSGGWTVQLGAFGERDNALALEHRLDDLRAGGELDEPVAVEVRGRLHHVSVGRFRDRRNADAMRRDLERLGFSAIVVPLR